MVVFQGAYIRLDDLNGLIAAHSSVSPPYLNSFSSIAMTRDQCELLCSQYEKCESYLLHSNGTCEHYGNLLLNEIKTVFKLKDGENGFRSLHPFFSYFILKNPLVTPLYFLNHIGNITDCENVCLMETACDAYAHEDQSTCFIHSWNRSSGGEVLFGVKISANPSSKVKEVRLRLTFLSQKFELDLRLVKNTENVL